MTPVIWIPVLILIALLAYIATRPDTFRVKRSAQINAPAHMIFPLINNFHQWTRWSPYENLDPGLKRTYSGADAGPGAIYAWSGNAKAGQGRMTIIDGKPDQTIRIQLEFTKPFTATNDTLFSLVPSSNGTTVTWAMDGKNNFMGKAFSVFVNMEKLVGGDFEKGLANLNTAAQADAKRLA